MGPDTRTSRIPGKRRQPETLHRMIDAAIVGMGRWGRLLVDAVQKDGTPLGPHLRFVVGQTRTPAAARDYAARQKIRIVDDYAAVLADAGVGAVVLATPHDQHARQIEAAAAAGKHVFVEKPFTLTRASAKAAAEAADRARVVLALGHNRRFLAATAELKRLIDGGALGSLIHLEGNFSGNFGYTYKPGMWRADEGGATGAMTAMGIHVIDSFIHLAGPIVSVRATAVRRALTIAMDDAVLATVRFANGASGVLSTILTTPRQWRIQAFGSKAWAHMRDHHVLDVCGEDAIVRTHVFVADNGLRAELDAFARAAAGGPAYPLPLDQAVHGVAVLEAILASHARNGAEVAVTTH
jgi:predicted dehydrogenase